MSTITRPEMLSLERELRAEIARLAKRLKDGVHVNMGDRDHIHGDKVGRDKNSDAAIKIIAGALVFVSMIVAWLFYYVATTANKATPLPPSVRSEHGE